MTTTKAPAAPTTAAGSTAATTTDEPVQLRLLDGGRRTSRPWQLDARTRRIGRERVAEAREILRRAQPPEPTAPHRHKIAG